MNEFGNIVPSHALEIGAIETLRKWLWPTYTSAVEANEFYDLGGKSLPRINSWSRRSHFDTLPGDDFLPLVAVVAPGTGPGTPEKDGKRRYRASWSIDVGVVVSEPEEPRRLASYMGAAIRACLSQKGLEGFPSDHTVDWTGERADDLPIEADRSLAAARIQFVVGVYDVLTINGGPAEPYPEPQEPGPVETILTHNIHVHQKEA